jgi:histone H2A
MLGANKVEKIDDLSALKGMKQLFQLDLINNPVQKEAGYRVKVFSLLSSLTVLDTLDKSGKDAFNTTSMVQTVSRVPQTLFDTSKPSPSPFGSGSIFGSTVPTGGLFGSTAPTGSLFGTGKSSSKPGGIFGTSAPTGSLFASSAPAVAPTVTKKRSKKGVTTLPTRPAVPSVPAPPSTRVSKASKGAKGGKAVAPKAAHGRSARAGIVFPVTRIKRHLRDASVDMRVSVGSSVFLAAVLEYLTAELVELAGNACKADKKARITPRMIKFAIDND